MTRKIITRLQKTLAQEQGAVSREWGHRQPVALVYPNAYEVGMSNLGFQAIYRLLNDHPDLTCERSFIPTEEDRLEYQRTGTPLLSLESQRPLTDFAAVAFSISFEADYPNVLQILDLAHLPLLAADRGAGFPLVIAGGVTTWLNPEPLAPFIDAFFLGEGEINVTRLAEFLPQRGEVPKEQLLADMAMIPGVYIPTGYTPTYNQDGALAAFQATPGFPPLVPAPHLAALDTYPIHSRLIAPSSEFGRMFLLEVNRGCGRGCRFCAAGFVYRPPRQRSLAELTKQVQEGLSIMPKIGLVGTAVSEAPALKELGRQVVEAGGKLGISSIRADCVDQELLGLLAQGGVNSIALAPEAGSERLRRVINKDLTEEELSAAVIELHEAGIANLRLYFMMGLPTETIEDVHDIARLVKRLRHQVTKNSRGRRQFAGITISLSSFVPKPCTPFQWVPFVGVAALKERIKIVKRDLQGIPNVRVYADLPKWAYIQALLSRGDRRVGELLLAYHRNSGNWSQAFQQSPINPDFFVLRERPREELFPWDFIDHGIKKSYLWGEYQRGLSGQETPPCDPEVCRRCGVCNH